MNKIAAALFFAPLLLSAQSTDNPLSNMTRMLYTNIKNNLVRSAEKMPEAEYAFKPSPDVRSFGQILGHVADANYMFCAPVVGDAKPPVSGIEKAKTTKAELTAALKEAFAYCDKAYDSLTDAEAAQTVKLFNGERPKLGVLNFNVAHDFEHYGNVVTYLRIKGIVPPSSEPRRPAASTPKPAPSEPPK